MCQSLCGVCRKQEPMELFNNFEVLQESCGDRMMEWVPKRGENL